VDLMRGWRTLAAVGVLLAAVIAPVSCASRDIPYAKLNAKYELETSQRFEPSEGLIVHYTDEGRKDGPAIVLVHGFAASSHTWRPWVERLKGDYRLVALDLPGHGLTQAPKAYRSSLDGNVEIISALADHLSVDRFVIAGNSMGGAVSWNYALRHPERLDGLVLVNAAGWPGEQDRDDAEPPLAFRLLTSGAGRAVLKMIPPAWLAGGLNSAYNDKSLVTPELKARYADLARGPGHRDILLTQRSRPGIPITQADFARITTPTLALVGDEDKIIPSKLTIAMAEAIPGAKLVRYPKGGHVPMEQLPDESVRDLRAFLEQVGAGTRTSADASPGE
jgi:pimeloyl-ACP methyl ester carboxylesterase